MSLSCTMSTDHVKASILALISGRPDRIGPCPAPPNILHQVCAIASQYVKFRNPMSAAKASPSRPKKNPLLALQTPPLQPCRIEDTCLFSYLKVIPPKCIGFASKAPDDSIGSTNPLVVLTALQPGKRSSLAGRRRLLLAS
jgi:hypothetical protein